MDKPPFDPSKPFEAGDKPAFDPSKPFEAAPQVGVTEDVLKSGGIGLVKGGIGLAGMGGDTGSAIRAGVDAGANKLGIAPETVDKARDVLKGAGHVLPALGMLFGPSSDEIQKGIEKHTGEFYKPQTTAGEYAQTTGEFAPALLGGGEGLLSRLATRVVAPAVASETAGQLTKGTAAEPYARIAGAVTGGAGASRLASTLARAPEVVAPTVEELKDAARAQYNHPDVRDVRFAAQPTEDLANRAAIALRSDGFRPNLEQNGKPVFGLVDELRGASNVADIDGVRKALGNIAKDRDTVGQLTPNAVAANRAIDHINDFLPNLRQSDLLAGDARRASQILGDARANWGAAKRAEEVATRAENGRIQAASTYGGGNLNNATRQALRPLVKDNFKRAYGFNDAEQQALSTAVEGTRLGNTARQVGKLGPDTGLKGLEHIITAFKTGGASIPLSLASLGAKIGGDTSTRRAVSRLETMLRERSPLHNANVAAAPPAPPALTGPAQGALPSGALAGLLAAQASRLQQPSPVSQ